MSQQSPSPVPSGKTTTLVIRVTGFVIVVSIIAAVGGLLFGFDTGVISGAILFIASQFHLNSAQEEFTTSVVLIGAIAGAMLGGVFADRLGRRRTIMGAAVIFLLGTAIAAIAGDVFVLWIGRIVVGMAIGMASFVVPLYISELAPPQTRGLMTSLNQIALTSGILLAYAVDYVYSASANWRAMFAWGLLPGAVLLVGMRFMPYSPRWLLSKQRGQDARRALTRIHGTTEVEAEVTETVVEIKAELSAVKGLAVLETRALEMPLIIGVGLAILQQVTGINTVIYYAPTIFKNAGFSTASSSIAATAGVGAVNLLFTIFAAFLVDRAGRRPLLLISLMGMVVGLVALAVGFLVADSGGAGDRSLGAFTVICLMIYIASFAIGLGPIFWLLISEIYPLNARGAAMSLATVANWGANFLVAVTFLSLVNLLTQGGTFLLYAVIGVMAWIFAFRLVPETKGKTLEQIQAHWQAGRHPREMGGAAAPTGTPES